MAKTMHFDNEKVLIDALYKMDQDAIEFAWREYFPQLVRFAGRMVYDQSLSEEYAAQAFKKMIEELVKGKGPKKSVRAYLFRSTKNIALNDIKKKTNNAEPLDLLTISENTSLESQVDEIIEKKRILQALNRLTRDQKELMVLRFIDDLTMRETAEIMGKSINAIKTMQQRAIGSLKKAPEFKEKSNE